MQLKSSLLSLNWDNGSSLSWPFDAFEKTKNAQNMEITSCTIFLLYVGLDCVAREFMEKWKKNQLLLNMIIWFICQCVYLVELQRGFIIYCPETHSLWSFPLTFQHFSTFGSMGRFILISFAGNYEELNSVKPTSCNRLCQVELIFVYRILKKGKKILNLRSWYIF